MFDKMKGIKGFLMCTLILMGLFAGSFIVAPVSTGGLVQPMSGTLFIYGNTTLTGNVYETVEIKADNIVLDLNGYSVIGAGTGFGIYLNGRTGVTIKNGSVKGFVYGIYLNSSSNNRISGNKIMNNVICGIGLSSSSSYNNISENVITNNQHGIDLINSSNNKFYHNSFINNTNQVFDWGWMLYPLVPRSVNVWDDGYPSGGNYWSDYNGTDLHRGPYQNETGSDGIGDTPYVIDANNRDNYPLMNPWAPIDTTPPVIHIISPENTTYTTNSVPLTFTVNEPTSWMGYSLDNQPNVTITGNTTFIGLPSGAHNIRVYAKDTAGNMGASEKIYFTVSPPPPIYPGLYELIRMLNSLLSAVTRFLTPRPPL